MATAPIPISIPGDYEVPPGEVISLDFTTAGKFKVVYDHSAFTPDLPSGHFDAGNYAGTDGKGFQADSKKEHYLVYDFQPDHGVGVRSFHTIHISNTGLEAGKSSLTAMKPIPIPADITVDRKDVVQLEFHKAGTIEPLYDAGAFAPALSQEHHAVGLDDKSHTADDKEHMVIYRFTPDEGGTGRSLYKIHVA